MTPKDRAKLLADKLSRPMSLRVLSPEAEIAKAIIQAKNDILELAATCCDDLRRDAEVCVGEDMRQAAYDCAHEIRLLIDKDAEK